METLKQCNLIHVRDNFALCLFNPLFSVLDSLTVLLKFFLYQPLLP